MSRAPTLQSAGFIDPAGPFARVNQESVLLLGGPRALLLQLAHPLIAAGVADHSGFLENPLQRLWSTLDAMLTLVFGDRPAALARAERIREIHAQVHGTLGDPTARFPMGTPYDAQDPELALWVHATLVDSALVSYETFVAPLSQSDRDGFYQESKIIARLLGIPDAVLPENWLGFRRYVEGSLDNLEVTPAGRAMADAVLHPPIRFLPRAVGDLAGLLSVGLLPDRVRIAYGLPWGRGHRALWRFGRRLVRATLPWLPEIVRSMPHARRARS